MENHHVSFNMKGLKGSRVGYIVLHVINSQLRKFESQAMGYNLLYRSIDLYFHVDKKALPYAIDSDMAISLLLPISLSIPPNLSSQLPRFL